ncbi:MAG: ATPase, T2SS/T4P/T4SS family [Pirellulaceae bacterium]
MLEVQSQRKKNIVSIEGPIEFSAAFVRQMAVDLKHDITMTSGLKTILRMDPDIIFVGEIRDSEAADIAMRAASSGRYVFSTLHTRDVSSTITALRDLRISNRSIAANVAGIVNQRLLRSICSNCKDTIEIEDSERQLFHEHGVQPPDTLAVGRGCEKCRHTGHLGRVGVFEVASMTPDFAQLIVGDASENEVHELLRTHHVHSLMNDALHKVAAHEAALPEAMGLRWI